MPLTVPVIDLFAGPGGLGEGFSAFTNTHNNHPFSIRLSIEKEVMAHRTLELRAFYRQFSSQSVPEEYYYYLQGQITRQDLFQKFPDEAKRAQRNAWCATLGKTSHEEVMIRIHEAISRNCKQWVLIGGPPCQAYSLAGRSRRKHDEDFATDERHFLYREYLRILADRAPAVFVIENVQGILSSKANGEYIFKRILQDLVQPRAALLMHEPDLLKYRLYSLNGDYEMEGLDLHEKLTDKQMKDFIVRADRHGIPQTRPRVFIIGIRTDIQRKPGKLVRNLHTSTVEQAISDLPPIRSRISRGVDSPEAWYNHIRSIEKQSWLTDEIISPKVRAHLRNLLPQVCNQLSTGAQWIKNYTAPRFAYSWFYDKQLKGVINHEARGHMPSDLWRYFFAATFAKIEERSPMLRDFPLFLRPNHQNIKNSIENGTLFADRFRVQLNYKPATTIVAHISQDGHYYIHPDPLQCRSLTVREAARLQTFPDNYFFEGSRTSQYHQVGNAVPPMLARQIAEIVYNVLK